MNGARVATETRSHGNGTGPVRRSRSRERLLAAVALGAVAVALVSIGVDGWLSALNPPTPQSTAGSMSIMLALVVYVAVGGFLAYRLPTNVVGWAILTVGFFGCTNPLAMDYARYGLMTNPGSLPWASFWAWYASWSFELVFSAPILLILFYPDGALLSRRWRVLVYLIALLAVGSAFPYMFGPRLELGQGGWNLHVPNPVGIPGSGALMHVLEGVTGMALLPVVILAVAHLFIRYRRARQVQRLQVKWFLYSCVVAVAVLFIGTPIPAIGDVTFGIGLAVFPIAVAVAILRYRLYDIDRIISRTVTYALVLAVVIGAYLVVVLAFSTLSPLGGDSPVVVAVSTLVAAACFRPLLTRLRDRIDRRFNRARYDAARTLEGFSQRLSSEVELSTLTHDLLAVVGATIQPRRLSLWLRDERAGGAASQYPMNRNDSRTVAG